MALCFLLLSALLPHVRTRCSPDTTSDGVSLVQNIPSLSGICEFMILRALTEQALVLTGLCEQPSFPFPI